MKALDLLPKLTPEVIEKIEGILANAPAAAVSHLKSVIATTEVVYSKATRGEARLVLLSSPCRNFQYITYCLSRNIICIRDLGVTLSRVPAIPASGFRGPVNYGNPVEVWRFHGWRFSFVIEIFQDSL